MVGKCVRFPPQVVTVKEEDGTWIQEYAFPLVLATTDCGEFKEKEVVQ